MFDPGKPILSYEVMELLKKIDEKKLLLHQHRPFPTHVVQSIQQSLTIEWTYNSNSIEGNTLTLQETRMVLEDGLTVGGKALREHFETVNHHEAIHYVEQLASDQHELRERDILNIHELVMDKLDKDFAGRIRNAGVRITGANFTPPSARKVPDLLEELISWINHEHDQMHDIIKAAIFHHRFVWIHPFFDGNGRTVRLVYNLFLIRLGFPPAIILTVDRKKYYQALNQSNKGDYDKLFLLICQAVLRSLDIYLSNLSDTAGDYAPIKDIVQESATEYSSDYVSLLARQGKIDAYKEGRIWYTSEKAIEEYVNNRRRNR
jgi:Fic family protein